MEIGSEMNHSQLFQTGVHSFGAIRFGIALVAQIRMVMDIRIRGMENPEKVKQAPLVMQMHSPMTHHSGTILMGMAMATTNPATWVMNVLENPEQVKWQFNGTK